MLGFKSFLDEMVTNNITKSQGLSANRTFDPSNPNNAHYKKVGTSVTGEHDIYFNHNENTGKSSHIWVHNKTKSLDLAIVADAQAPSTPKADPVYSNLLVMGKTGKGIAHHAYYDLMRRGIVLTHDNQSKGAVKVRRKLVATYPQVVYHSYNPVTKEASPYDRGMSLNPDKYSNFKFTTARSGGLAKHLSQQKIVGFLPPKYRLKE